MWSVPLIVGAAVAPVWQWRTLILIVAALAFFLVRYPLATIIKTRKRPTTDRAWWLRWAIGYGAIATVCGAWLILIEQLYLLIPIGLIGALLVVFNLWLVARKQERSVYGELSGIAGLALGAPLTYYAASGQLDLTALVLWLVNALYFGGTVFYIKLKVRQQPRLPAPERLSERLLKAKDCLTYQTVVLTLIIVSVGLIRLPWLVPLAFLPMTLKVLYGALRWQDKGFLGYYGVQKLPATITDLDRTRPIWDTGSFFGKRTTGHYSLDVNLRYRTRLFTNKIGTTLQLNVRNLQESGGRLQAIGAFPDGTPHTYRIVDPRQFILTATFDL